MTHWRNNVEHANRRHSSNWSERSTFPLKQPQKTNEDSSSFTPFTTIYCICVFEKVNHEKCLDKTMRRHCRGEFYAWEYSFVFHEQTNTTELKSTIFTQHSFFLHWWFSDIPAGVVLTGLEIESKKESKCDGIQVRVATFKKQSRELQRCCVFDSFFFDQQTRNITFSQIITIF